MTDESADASSTARPPGDVSHLNRLLQSWSDAVTQGGQMATAGRLRRLVGIVVVASILDGLKDENGVERIGFKGGSALELRFGFRARTSKDLDAAYRGELFDGLELIRAALLAGRNGFTGTITEPEAIARAGIDPPPLRTEIKLRYKNKPFVTIPFEVSAAEGRSMDAPERLSAAVHLQPVRLEGPETIAFLPLRYQIAQKLHACTEDVGDPPNPRVRDLADLLLVEELAVTERDLPAIRAASIEIFAGRGRQPWPPQVLAFPGWDRLWAELVASENLAITLEEAVEAVSRFIARVDAADAEP